jgi:hypothetical protein
VLRTLSMGTGSIMVLRPGRAQPMWKTPALEGTTLLSAYPEPSLPKFTRDNPLPRMTRLSRETLPLREKDSEESRKPKRAGEPSESCWPRSGHSTRKACRFRHACRSQACIKDSVQDHRVHIVRKAAPRAVPRESSQKADMTVIRSEKALAKKE